MDETKLQQVLRNIQERPLPCPTLPSTWEALVRQGTVTRTEAREMFADASAGLPQPRSA